MDEVKSWEKRIIFGSHGQNDATLKLINQPLSRALQKLNNSLQYFSTVFMTKVSRSIYKNTSVFLKLMYFTTLWRQRLNKKYTYFQPLVPHLVCYYPQKLVKWNHVCPLEVEYLNFHQAIFHLDVRHCRYCFYDADAQQMKLGTEELLQLTAAKMKAFLEILETTYSLNHFV